jgi:FkbM family methyltransferase
MKISDMQNLEVVCISCSDRQDRRDALLNNLRECNWPFPQPSFWNALTPKDVVMPDYYREKKLPGGHAAMRSHLDVAQYSLGREDDSLVMVLEDDAEFSPDFVPQLERFLAEVPETWDCLMIGWLPSGIMPIRISEHAALAQYNMGLQCYIVRATMLPEWIARLKKDVSPADYVMASLMPEFNVIAPFPYPLCKQSDGMSSVSNTYMKKIDAFGRLHGRDDAPPPDLSIPPDQKEGAAEIFRGEYEPACNFKTPPRILDVGGNVGLFAVWAMGRFPGCRITSYEPMPGNLEHLRKNVGDKVAVVGKAVSSAAPKPVKMFGSSVNCGCCSMHDIGQQDLSSTIEVPTVHPGDLPACDILKIDTEGCELDILLYYKHLPIVVMLEYHSESDRVAIDNLMASRGYALRDLRIGAFGKITRGVVKYWKKSNELI